MDLAAIAGTALGLAFIYLLLSLVCSTIQEWIAGVLRRRAANLKEGLLALLADPKAVDTLFKDPMLQSMMARGIFSNRPRPKSLAYLPADRFSNALLNQFVHRARRRKAAPRACCRGALSASHLSASAATRSRASGSF